MLSKSLIFIITIVNALNVYKHENTTSYSKKCFQHLGCLETTSEWFDDKYRPRNLEPLDRHTIRTEFLLISKDEAKPLNYETITLHKGNLSAHEYQTGLDLILFIHDFTSNGYTGWVKHIVLALSAKVKANMISVDWEAGAEPPFEQAISNARVVALEIIAFIRALKSNRMLSEEHIQIIGHGVGAHIAGYVGGSVHIGKITGLDPTGPFFEELPSIVRLDSGDAGYVEVLHTDAFNQRSQGAKKSVGHADFFMNGAKLQPECNQSTDYPVFTKIDRNVLKEGVILPACSHKRAFKYYIEALETTDCEFTGIPCANYEDFINGKCTGCADAKNNPSCTTFGLIHSFAFTNSNHNFYINTRGEPPFCLNSYKITFELENNETAKKQQGNFDLFMLGEGGVMVNASSSYYGTHTHTHTFEVGKSYSLVYYASQPRLSKIIEVRLRWTHNPDFCVAFCNTDIYVKKISIGLLSVYKPCDWEINHLCPSNGKAKIENGNFVVFTVC